MDTASAENLVLEEGKSSELAQCLQLIQETTVDDVDKYPEKTCRDLARHIVCRTYAPVVHELCHLVVVAAHHGSPSGRYEELFWDSGPARTAGFRAHLQARPAGTAPLAVDAGEAVIEYADGTFAVSYGRMPLLSALMEFMMTALGYTALDEPLASLLGEFPTQADVSEAAKDLSRRLYAYLQDHLPPVQAQKKHRSFLGFAAERGGGSLNTGSVDDELVLEYWLAHSAGADGADAEPGGEVDARTFKGVFETAARLIRILRFAEEKYRLNGALPIGTDRESGEVDPADMERAIDEIETGDDPFAAADEKLGGAVKFLNKRELATLGEALHDDAAARALTRSILRSAVFGQAQARLTQAQRDRSRSGRVEALIETLPDDDYTGRLSAYRGLVEHLDRVALAGLHVLAKAGHAAALPLATAIRPDLDLADLAGPAEPDWSDTNVVSLRAASAGRDFLARLRTADGSDLAGLGADAEAAFKAVSRKGFSAKESADPETVAAFADGTEMLMAVRRALIKYLEDHAATIDWADQFEVDRPRFVDQFLLLYGGRDG